MKKILICLLFCLFFICHTIILLCDIQTNKDFVVLNFLYKKKIGKFVRPLFTNHFTSNFLEYAANCSLSRYCINSFIKKHKIDMSEFIIPIGGYKSFNDFFYRKLKPGARTINFDENTVTSPADCKIFAIPKLDSNSTFFVKNCKFDLKLFLNNESLAKDYQNGTLLLFRLAPQDYHRFHVPFDCVPNKAELLNGKLESVNPTVYLSGIQPLTTNERHLIKLKSNNFDQVLFVPVGAMMVGKIKETYTPNQFYKKGEELGYFAFGGSSIVMIFKPNVIKVNDQIIQNSSNQTETSIKMGQSIATKI